MYLLIEGCQVIVKKNIVLFCPKIFFLYPSAQRVGDIMVLVRIPSALVLALALSSAFNFLHYLLNQSMDFDQTCIDTLL